MGDDGSGLLISLDGVAPRQMSVRLPLLSSNALYNPAEDNIQLIFPFGDAYLGEWVNVSSDTGSPG